MTWLVELAWTLAVCLLAAWAFVLVASLVFVVGGLVREGLRDYRSHCHSMRRTREVADLERQWSLS